MLRTYSWCLYVCTTTCPISGCSLSMTSHPGLSSVSTTRVLYAVLMVQGSMATSPLMLRRHTGSRAAVVVRPVGSICHLTNRCTTIDASAVHNHKCRPNKHVCVHAFVCQKKNSLTVFLPLDMLFTSINLIIFSEYLGRLHYFGHVIRP